MRCGGILLLKKEMSLYYDQNWYFYIYAYCLETTKVLELLEPYILTPESTLALLATCKVLFFCVTCEDPEWGPVVRTPWEIPKR